MFVIGALALFLSSSAEAGKLMPGNLVQTARAATKVNPELFSKAVHHRRKLHEKILSEAKPRKLQNDNYNYNNNGQQQQNNYQQNNGNNYQNYQEDQQQAQQQYQQQQYQYNQQQWNNQNAYEQAEADWSNWQSDWYWNQAMEEEDFGFQISNFAIKFTQCATVETYSDDLADNEYTDTVLAAQRFAIFRLCPANTCSVNSNQGCTGEYGEYIASMDQYLAALMEEEEERVIQYCQYCQNCATIESAKSFWRDVAYTRQMTVTKAEEGYQEWYETNVANYANQQQEANQYQQDGNWNNYQQNGNTYQNVEGMDESELAQAYYNHIRDRGDYANQYYQNNYNGNNNGYNGNQNQNGNNQNNEPTYQWSDEQYWQFKQTSQSYNDNQNTWSHMGSGNLATFYGKEVYNGYFDQNGDFEYGWGYFNQNGEFVFLDEEQAQGNQNNNGNNAYADGQMQWDESIWGEMPGEWSDITLESESCNFEYAGSCYNQYDACMAILKDYDYWAYRTFASGQAVDSYQQGKQQYDEDEAVLTLKDMMSCTEYEVVKQDGNDYANQAYYQQKYQEKQEWLQNDYNCYDGDEYCEQAREYAMQKYEYELQRELQRRYYIGPHCSSSGRQISLAVFQDEYCSVIDEETSLESLVGYDPSDGLELVPDDCIACGVNQEMMNEAMWYEDEDMTAYMIEPMCSMLYQLAGKCNQHLTMNANYVNNYQYQNEGDQWNQVFQSEQQAANEEAVCSFLDSLKSNTYDEYGQVMLTNEQTWKNPAAWSTEFSAEKRALSPGMKASVSLLSIAVAVMGVWACFLHGTLARKNIPWRPRRKAGEDPTDIARQNSGIVMGRSRSGPSGAPLI